MELRHEGYGALIITDDGARVSLSPKEVREFLSELANFAYDLHMTGTLLERFGDTALVDVLEANGASVTWPIPEPLR